MDQLQELPEFPDVPDIRSFTGESSSHLSMNASIQHSVFPEASNIPPIEVDSPPPTVVSSRLISFFAGTANSEVDTESEEGSSIVEDKSSIEKRPLPLSGIESPPLQQYFEQVKPEYEDIRSRLVKNITISRDQTAASDFQKEILTVLRERLSEQRNVSKKGEEGILSADQTPSVTPASLGFENLPNQTLILGPPPSGIVFPEIPQPTPRASLFRFPPPPIGPPPLEAEPSAIPPPSYWPPPPEAGLSSTPPHPHPHPATLRSHVTAWPSALIPEKQGNLPRAFRSTLSHKALTRANINPPSNSQSYLSSEAMASKQTSVNHELMDDDGLRKQTQLLETMEQEGDEMYGADILRHLVQRIGKLEKENKHLKAKKSDEWKPAKFQVFHHLANDRMAYLGEPLWDVDSRGKFGLKGNLPIADSDRYLERNEDVVFVINKTYIPPAEDDSLVKQLREADTLPAPKPAEESLQLVSNDMIEAVEDFLSKQPKFREEFPNFSAKSAIQAPYLFWYHYRSSNALQELQPQHQYLLKLLTGWIDENYQHQYAHADAQFAAGLVSRSTMKYLVRPGDVLVTKAKGYPEAYLATSWAVSIGDELKLSNNNWNVAAWSYEYHGSFYRENTVLRFQLHTKGPDEEMNIEDLDVLPLRFASDKLQAVLELRGRTFWSCRNKRLVSYQDDVEESLYGVSVLDYFGFSILFVTCDQNGERFMVDFNTYRELHSDSAAFRKPYGLGIAMDSKIMERDEPPSQPELYLFPPTIIGYNLRRKKWREDSIIFPCHFALLTTCSS